MAPSAARRCSIRNGPLGAQTFVPQLGEAFGSDDADGLARRHVEMFFVLARLLKHGSLAPGRYALDNIGVSDVREAMRGYGGADGVTDADVGLDSDGQVLISDDHFICVSCAPSRSRWPSDSECVEERLAVGEYPAAVSGPEATLRRLHLHRGGYGANSRRASAARGWR